MKTKLYIQPIVEVLTINVANTICAVSLNAPLSNGGGSNGDNNIDPEHAL